MNLHISTFNFWSWPLTQLCNFSFCCAICTNHMVVFILVWNCNFSAKLRVKIGYCCMAILPRSVADLKGNLLKFFGRSLENILHRLSSSYTSHRVLYFLSFKQQYRCLQIVVTIIAIIEGVSQNLRMAV